jgi:hypothetical protein
MTTWKKITLGMQLFNAVAWTLLATPLAPKTHGLAWLCALFFWLAFASGMVGALEDEERQRS